VEGDQGGAEAKMCDRKGPSGGGLIRVQKAWRYLSASKISCFRSSQENEHHERERGKPFKTWAMMRRKGEKTEWGKNRARVAVREKS